MQENLSNQRPVEVCAAIIIKQGEILITKRPEDKRLGGYWEFPGGKVDDNETQQQALIRELKEELDIEISVGDLFETVHHRYDWGQVMILAYLCTWKSGQLKHLEVADHRWVKAEDLMNFNILPADQPIIKKLQTIFS
jgi:8-oxo-dGTP diphosphatase